MLTEKIIFQNRGLPFFFCFDLPPTPGLSKGHRFSVFFGTLPLFSEHFTKFSSSSNHRNFFVPFPFPFPSIPGNNSLWFPFPNFGNVFFHSLPVPEFRECLFSFPSRSRILGMDFFIPFPFPNFGNGIFNSLPVPKLWEWNFLFPFPFPNPQKSFPLTPGSRRHVMRTPGDPGRGGGFGGDSSAGCFWRMGCRSWGQPCVLSPACRPQRPGWHRQSPHPSKGYGPCSVLEFESQGVRWWCLLLTWSRNRLHLFWLLSVGERKWKWETVCWYWT